MAAAKSLRSRTALALLWSALQNWSVKLLALGLFVVLARLLSPAEMGVAAAVLLVLAAVAIVAELGLPDAIVRSPRLLPAHLDQAFGLALAVSLLAALALLLLPGPLAALAMGSDTPGAAACLALAAPVPPLAVVVAFQTAWRKQQLDFRSVARAGIAATLVSGAIGLALAASGFGAASLVVQAGVAAGVAAVLLSRGSSWRPQARRDGAALRALARYGSGAMASRALDFLAARLVEVVVLAKLGVAGLGLYAVGSKLYLTLLQLLGGMLTDVATAALSKIVERREALAEQYHRFVYLAASTTLPVFVAVAACAHELTALLFGARWAASAGTAQWLCLLGAVQVVQFFNGALLAADGRAGWILGINLLKALAALAVLTLAPASGTETLALHFLLSQLLVAPLSFWSVARVIRPDVGRLVQALWPGLLAALCAAVSVAALRPLLADAGWPLLARCALLLAAFALVHAAALLVLSRQRLFNELRYLRMAWQER